MSLRDNVLDELPDDGQVIRCQHANVVRREPMLLQYGQRLTLSGTRVHAESHRECIRQKKRRTSCDINISDESPVHIVKLPKRIAHTILGNCANRPVANNRPSPIRCITSNDNSGTERHLRGPRKKYYQNTTSHSTTADSRYSKYSTIAVGVVKHST